MMAEDEQVRCYGHAHDPHHQAGAHYAPLDGWPAHQWTSPSPGACRHCPQPISLGDRYVCVDGGVIHATCVAGLDAAVMDGEPG